MKAYNVVYGPNVGNEAFVVDIPIQDCDIQKGSILKDADGKRYTVKGIHIDGSPTGTTSILLIGKPNRDKTVLYA